MKHVATLFFVLAGLVNFMPVVGVLGKAQLEAAYGITLLGDDLVLLLRHRAVLFGLLGSFIVLAAFKAQWRALATVAGIISMGAYLLLALPVGSHGAAVQKVFWVDVVACVLLLAAFLLSRHATSSAVRATP